MRKFLVFTALLTALASAANAQMANPVQWNWTAKKLADKSYELHMTAVIDNNWHIYAQEAGEGPEPTTFTFKTNPLVKLDGKIREDGKLEKTFDQNFNSTLKFYANKVDFVQKVKMKSAASTAIKGTVLYMVCDDKKCLPPKEIPFSIKIDGK